VAQKLYEAMFIVDSNKAREGYEKMEEVCLSCITRHGAEIAKCIKWDDRRLAYEIQKAKRGTFILVHFNSDTQAIQKIERQIQLSDQILRCLITVDEDGLETNTGAKPAVTAEATAEKAAEKVAAAE
jgi:small subunit ribosomal protein S6